MLFLSLSRMELPKKDGVDSVNVFIRHAISALISTTGFVVL